MQDRFQVTALRNCMFLELFTDAENLEARREIIDLDAGQSRGDIQFVLALDGSMSDLPPEFEHLDEDSSLSVVHPIRVGETCEAYGVLRLVKLP